MKINQNYLKLNESYLFSRIAQKVAEFQKENPEREVIRLGIGDVTLPLVPAVTQAMQKAVAEMGQKETFRGYAPEQGYAFLREAVRDYYKTKNVSLDASEIFVSDGAKSDLGNILDLFDESNSVLIPSPVYPVYVDTNIMAGRETNYAVGSRENDFLPMPEQNIKADIIYLCSPGNPTGAVYDRHQLKEWVDYANKNGAVILFDGAYEAFVRDESLPTSIYQIDGAKECAVEFCSFSKTAGFTGTRCGYTAVPKELKFGGASLNAMWLRRQTTKFNGVPYVVQRGAEAVFSPEGLKQTRENIKYYKKNALIIGSALKELGIWFTGGENSPYIWMECPGNMKSWDFFDMLLQKAGVVGTPGSGFGESGEGYFRFSCFNDNEKVEKAMARLKKL